MNKTIDEVLAGAVEVPAVSTPNRAERRRKLKLIGTREERMAAKWKGMTPTARFTSREVRKSSIHPRSLKSPS